jgi:antitoxin ParD1/3/4
LTDFVRKGYFHATYRAEQAVTTTSLNISLPEALKEYVQERVAEKAYSNPSDYIRALIREDRKRRAEEKLEQLLLEGIASGEPRPYDFEQIRREVRRRLAAEKRQA